MARGLNIAFSTNWEHSSSLIRADDENQRRLAEISVPDLLHLRNSKQTDTERGHLIRHFAGVPALAPAMQNEKNLPVDVAHHPPSGPYRYLKSKLQALRIPISFTTNAKISQEVAKF
jgi:hypothetical protein